MGFLSDIFKTVAPIGASLIPGIGPIAGPVVGGLLSNIGNNKARGQEQQAVQQAQTAARPLNVFGPTSSTIYNASQNSLRTRLDPTYERQSRRLNKLGSNALEQYAQFQPQGYDVEAEVERLRKLRAPDIAQARASLQSQLLNRGRLGLGVGGGRSGGLFNPETAAQEEAIMQAQLGDIGHAQDQALKREALDYDRQGQLLENSRGLFNLGGATAQGGAGTAALSLQGRLPSGIAALQAGFGQNQANTTRGFFSSLGVNANNSIQGIDWGGIFGQSQPKYPSYGGGFGDYQGQ